MTNQNIKKSKMFKKQVNKLYNEMKFMLTNDSDVLISKLQMSVYSDRINNSFNEINKLTSEYKNIIEKSPPLDKLIEELSVHNLHDINDIEKNGKVSRITLKTALSANKIKQKALEKISNRENEISLFKISSIEMVENQIKALIDYLDSKEINKDGYCNELNN